MLLINVFLNFVLKVVERIPRRIFGSQPSTGRTTPVSTPASILEPLALALKQLDPLSEFTMQEMDPLSKMAAEMVNKKANILPYSFYTDFRSKNCVIQKSINKNIKKQKYMTKYFGQIYHSNLILPKKYAILFKVQIKIIYIGINE